MEKPRNASAEGGMTEVRKNVPVDRRIDGILSPYVDGDARSRIPNDGEVVEATIVDAWVTSVHATRIHCCVQLIN
jgi:hypothetical protein